MEIKWKKGSRGKGSAKKCYLELEKIRKRDGVLIPAAVVKKAKAKTNPMHKEFTWDDNAAAEQHRLNQARLLMRTIEVIYEEAPMVPTRVYELITQPATKDKPARKAYQTVTEILADPIARDELLSRAIRDALAYRKRYNGLSELAKVFHVMDEFVENADKMLAG